MADKLLDDIHHNASQLPHSLSVLETIKLRGRELERHVKLRKIYPYSKAEDEYLTWKNIAIFTLRSFVKYSLQTIIFSTKQNFRKI